MKLVAAGTEVRNATRPTAERRSRRWTWPVEAGCVVTPPAEQGRPAWSSVLFDRRVWSELRRADLTAGAKEVIRAHAGEIVDVPVEDEGAFQDIDTIEDYEPGFGRLP